MTIYVDSFEPKKFERQIKGMRVPTAIKKLPAGDYAFGNIGIERKTIDDFINSVFQARMWDQLFKLKEVYEVPILVITGKEPFPTGRSMLNKLKGAWGAKWAIATKLKIPILEYNNDNQFIVALVQGYLKSTSKTLSYKPLPPKKHTIPEIQIDMLSRIPGIGIKTAKLLLEEYGNIEAIGNVPIKELSKFKTISEKKAKLLTMVIKGETKKKKRCVGTL